MRHPVPKASHNERSLCYRPAELADNDDLHAIAEVHYVRDVLIPPADYARFLSRDPPISWCVLERRDAREVAVGYFTLVPLATETFRQLASGEIVEREVTAKHIEGLDNAQVLYILEVTARHGRGPATLSALREVLNGLLSRHTNIGKVCAWAYSEVGKKLIRLLKFEPASTSETEFFEIAPADLVASMKDLRLLSTAPPARCEDVP